ncbi:MAG: hypothetical protein K6E11_03425 [Bacilli bacterium]|nr:hypothetical protein [Bacilli bacterium]
MISDMSLSVAVVVAICIYPRIFYSAIKNKRSFPDTLFKMPYVLLYIVYFVSGFSLPILALFFSTEFIKFGFFVGWILVALALFCLGILLWIWFFMHGYDIRYQFKRIVVPSPLSIIDSLLALVSAIFSMNYYMLGAAIAFTISNYLWSLKGYYLTKPKLFDEPEHDLEEY